MDPTSPAFGGIRGAQQALDGQAYAKATACKQDFAKATACKQDFAKATACKQVSYRIFAGR